jgi:hypothetical protein
MDFQILGPLEARSERGAVGLRGLKPRAVLAMLLLHANEPVSAERLAVGLWGQDAPAGAVKTVQVHVSRLRKALGDPETLTTTPAGYRLRVRPGELDAERFARGAAEGRRALEAGDAQRAGVVLREALELWHGRAGSDYLHCAFGDTPEPDCHGYAAIGNSLLRFHGMEVVGAIGRWKSGKVVSTRRSRAAPTSSSGSRGADARPRPGRRRPGLPCQHVLRVGQAQGLASPKP